jgi:hypothetical protein
MIHSPENDFVAFGPQQSTGSQGANGITALGVQIFIDHQDFHTPKEVLGQKV